MTLHDKEQNSLRIIVLGTSDEVVVRLPQNKRN